MSGVFRTAGSTTFSDPFNRETIISCALMLWGIRSRILSGVGSRSATVGRWSVSSFAGLLWTTTTEPLAVLAADTTPVLGSGTI